MHGIAFHRFDLPLALGAYGVVTLMVPLARLQMRTGVWGIVLAHSASRFQRAIGSAIGILIAAVGLYAVLLASMGPARVGVVGTPVWVRQLGWLLALAGTIGTVIAQHQMGKSWRVGIDDRRTDLIEHGLYRLVRNPIYAAMLVFMFGAVLLAPSAWSAATVCSSVTLIGWQARLEEAHLMALHGESYRAYASRVGRFLPYIGRLKGR